MFLIWCLSRGKTTTDSRRIENAMSTFQILQMMMSLMEKHWNQQIYFFLDLALNPLITSLLDPFSLFII